MAYSLTTIRAATPADAEALAGLADSSHSRLLRGRVLIAEGDQGPIAAIEVTSGAVIADPSYVPSAAVRAVTLLRRHRYLVLRQAGGGAQTRSLLRREAARLAA